MQVITLKKIKGTSIPEGIIVLTAFIGLLMLIPSFFKIIDFKATSPQVSRYIAWNYAMTHKELDSNKQVEEITSRVFNQDKLLKPEEEIKERSFWSIKNRSIFNNESSSIAKNNIEFNTSSKSIIKNVNNSINALSGKNFNFKEDFIEHKIALEIKTPDFIKGHNCNSEEKSALCFRLNTAMYIDRLSPSSNDELQNQVRSLKPFRSFKTMANTISNLVKNSYVLREGAGIENVPEYVIPDRVPRHTQ